MSDIQFDMSEVRALEADLVGAGPAAERSSSLALTVVAAGFAAAARADAPVDTGSLRNSIKVRSDGSDTRVISATARYASFVEFGTSSTGPQPFMWTHAPTASRALTEALESIDPFRPSLLG